MVVRGEGRVGGLREGPLLLDVKTQTEKTFTKEDIVGFCVETLDL